MSKRRYPIDEPLAPIIEVDEANAIQDAITIVHLIRDGHVDKAVELVREDEDYDYCRHHVLEPLARFEAKLVEALKPHRKAVKAWMKDMGIGDGR